MDPVDGGYAACVNARQTAGGELLEAGEADILFIQKTPDGVFVCFVCFVLCVLFCVISFVLLNHMNTMNAINMFSISNPHGSSEHWHLPRP